MSVQPFVSPPMLPQIREALLPLLDQLPPEHRDDVRAFARHAGALGYANGYADGFHDGAEDEQHLAAEETEATVTALHGLRVVPEQRQPEPQQPRDDRGHWQETPAVRCGHFYLPDGDGARHQCDLDRDHDGRLHETTDFPAGRRFVWSGRPGTQVQVLVPVGTLDALLRAVLQYDREPDPDRMRRMAADLRGLNLRDLEP